MRLHSLTYSEHKGTPGEWCLSEFELGDVNLLVGKNASGKSKILRVIYYLAVAVAGRRPVYDGCFHMCFRDAGVSKDYELEVDGQKVISEAFKIDGQNLLDRGENGVGEIRAERLNERLEFQIPVKQLAVVARRDSIQHPFLAPLHQWAESLYLFEFGTPLGKNVLGILPGAESGGMVEVDPKDPSQVVGIFHHGEVDFDTRFTSAIVEDFCSIGYPIEKVGLRTPSRIILDPHSPRRLMTLYVKECELQGITDQIDMSQGMFRALSIIIQVNYAVLSDTPSCILIDDIGEGLDFDRSCKLFDLLMEKAANSKVQLVMATNDRFVMNRVPLEAWSVIDRQQNRVRIVNYRNSREIFDRFKFTGLNNFDFLAFDYLHTADETNE